MTDEQIDVNPEQDEVQEFEADDQALPDDQDQSREGGDYPEDEAADEEPSDA